jgi:hypothetical protein
MEMVAHTTCASGWESKPAHHLLLPVPMSSPPCLAILHAHLIRVAKCPANWIVHQSGRLTYI